MFRNRETENLYISHIEVTLLIINIWSMYDSHRYYSIMFCVCCIWNEWNYRGDFRKCLKSGSYHHTYSFIFLTSREWSETYDWEEKCGLALRSEKFSYADALQFKLILAFKFNIFTENARYITQIYLIKGSHNCVFPHFDNVWEG